MGMLRRPKYFQSDNDKEKIRTKSESGKLRRRDLFSTLEYLVVNYYYTDFIGI